ncbi:hypothetical protein BJX68DRAFT_265213 [Aspergillus pseudodeflectus]|uniref:MARVEL domain-containing protein n=1 Tax=Aspergillus pseudodeflectus TaxID=176178 RepID=A0ABR4KL04_9EURO
MTPAPAPPPEYNSESPPQYTPPTRPNTPIDIKTTHYSDDPVSIHPLKLSHDYRLYALTLAVLRTLQYLLAVIIIAIYAPDPRQTSSTHAPAGWLYTGLVAWLSGMVCLLYFLIPVKHTEWWYTGDAVVAILWLVQVARFEGLLYPDCRVELEIGNAALSVTKIRRCVWVSLASLIVWDLGSEKEGIDAGEEFWSFEKTRSIETRCMEDLERFDSRDVDRR